MRDPADLLNVAIEHLVEQRFALPAFSPLDRLVGRVRHHVHHSLYPQIPQALSPAQGGRLAARVGVHNGRTEVTRLKAVPRGASLQHMRQGSHRLAWLASLVTTPPLGAGVANTKGQQCAAEAQALDGVDMRRIQIVPRRRALLVCLLHQAHVHTRDQWIERCLRRMRRTVTVAPEQRTELQDHYRALAAHRLAVFAEGIDHPRQTPEENAALGRGGRALLKNDGGAEALQAHYEQVSASHHQHDRPLLWPM